jgi:hypothetical protein
VLIRVHPWSNSGFSSTGQETVKKWLSFRASSVAPRRGPAAVFPKTLTGRAERKNWVTRLRLEPLNDSILAAPNVPDNFVNAARKNRQISLTALES